MVVVKPMLDRLGAFGVAELLRPGADDEAAFAALRGAETTGRPLGNAAFIAGLERILGRPIAGRAPAASPRGPPWSSQGCYNAARPERRGICIMSPYFVWML